MWNIRSGFFPESIGFDATSLLLVYSLMFTKVCLATHGKPAIHDYNWISYNISCSHTMHGSPALAYYEINEDFRELVFRT